MLRQGVPPGRDPEQASREREVEERGAGHADSPGLAKSLGIEAQHAVVHRRHSDPAVRDGLPPKPWTFLPGREACWSMVSKAQDRALGRHRPGAATVEGEAADRILPRRDRRDDAPGGPVRTVGPPLFPRIVSRGSRPRPPRRPPRRRPERKGRRLLGAAGALRRSSSREPSAADASCPAIMSARQQVDPIALHQHVGRGARCQRCEAGHSEGGDGPSDLRVSRAMRSGRKGFALVERSAARGPGGHPRKVSLLPRPVHGKERRVLQGGAPA